MPTGSTALSVRGLGKSFGTTRALHQVDLDVPAGQITSLLGPSGCGKTTFLRLVAGFLTPDRGSIELAGRVVADPTTWVAPQHRHIGYLPQEGALFPHLSVAGNIGFGLPRAQRTHERIAELLDLVELPSTMADRAPHELSGGQQQRVALARALAPSPQLVLLDEPFSALDAALRESTGRSVARALRAAGATGILVTHDQREALALADQVVTFRAGELVQAADPVTSYLRPADAEQARFVAHATLVAGQLSDDGQSVACVLGQLSVQPSTLAQGEVLVALRPEELTLSESDNGGAPGIVLETEYHGHDTAVHVMVDGQRLVARQDGGAPPELGAQVWCRVNHPVMVFPAPDQQK